MSEERTRSAEINPNNGRKEPETPHWSWREERRVRCRERKSENHLHGLFWGLVLVLVGTLFLAGQREWIAWDKWWQYLLIGLGAIFIINGLTHYFSSTGQHGIGKFIPGIILLLVGIAFVCGFSTWWPAILIGVGAAMLIGFLFHSKK